MAAVSTLAATRDTVVKIGRDGQIRRDRDEGGFTLVEVVIVSVILPLILGAVALAVVQVLSLQGGISKRISNSADAQIVSTYLDQDVQSATMLTTSATSTQCGPGTQLLGLEWSYNQGSATYQTVVSYVRVARAPTYSLLRQYCAFGASATPTRSSTVSSDIPAGQAPPTIAPDTLNVAALAGWTAAQPITAVTFTITEPGSNYPYTLVGLPVTTSSSGSRPTTSPPTTNCGFATPGTGTYARTLCFVDLSSYVATSPGCQTMVAAVANTPFTMKFCITVTGTAVFPASIPTYFAPPTSEAFLGNNGFYTGIPGNSALYQTPAGGTTTITITNIQVLDSNGNPATGWHLVSGDAESTDSGESIWWTSDQILNLLPNSPTSQIGNACARDYATVDLKTVGTKSVKCAAGVSSDKTGTVMLEAAAPTTLTVQMVGAGRQGVFVGLHLP